MLDVPVLPCPPAEDWPVPEVAAPPMRPAPLVALAAAPAGDAAEAPPELVLFAPALPDEEDTFGGVANPAELPDPDVWARAEPARTKAPDTASAATVKLRIESSS